MFMPYMMLNPADGSKNILEDKETEYKVFVYCRVSTDKEDQQNSLQSQKDYFDDQHKKHKNWVTYKLFYDEGISGTSLEHRTQFNEMIRRAKREKVNLILAKEVSRFSRNIRETLNTVEELKEKDVYVYFIADGIYTKIPEHRHILAYIAAAAEAESYKTSKRVKFGQEIKMNKGVTFGRKEMFGYEIKRDPETNEQVYVINEEEAEIIRKIYEWYSLGDGTFRIARRLEELGIRTKRYANGWSNTVILRILRNEKYAGHLFQGKTHTPDMLTHKKKYQKDENKWVKLYNHHTPIVDVELWNKVQAILKEKAPSEEQKLKHSNKYWLSGKCFCGVCRGKAVSNVKKKKTCTYKSWICFEAHNRGKYREDTVDGIPRGCNCGGMINDRLLQLAVHDLIIEYIRYNKDRLVSDILKEQEEKITPKKNNKRLITKLKKEIELKKQGLLNLYEDKLMGRCPQKMYDHFEEKFNKEIEALEEQLAIETADETVIHNIKVQTAERMKQIEYMLSLEDKDFNEDLYERITKKIVIYPEHILEIHLNTYPEPFFLHFTAKGKLDKYDAVFTVYSREDAMAIVGDKINNYVASKEDKAIDNVSEE